METPHLDNLINDLKAYDRNDMLSDDGRNQLNEYEAIKQALSLADVSNNEVELVCLDCKNSFTETVPTICYECEQKGI